MLLSHPDGNGPNWSKLVNFHVLLILWLIFFSPAKPVEKFTALVGEFFTGKASLTHTNILKLQRLSFFSSVYQHHVAIRPEYLPFN